MLVHDAQQLFAIQAPKLIWPKPLAKGGIAPSELLLSEELTSLMHAITRRAELRGCHLLPAKAGSLRLNPNANGISLDTIGRMTLAGYEATAHQQQTAQARVRDRGDRSPPCHRWYEEEQLEDARPFPHPREAVRGIPATGRRFEGVGSSSVAQVYHHAVCLASGSLRSDKLAARRFPRSRKRDGPRAVEMPYQYERSLLLWLGRASLCLSAEAIDPTVNRDVIDGLLAVTSYCSSK
jgi:hypothetical protein